MLFDTSVRKELARGFGATLVVILTIVLTMMLIRTLGMAARGAVSAQDVVLVLLYTALGYLPTVLTLSFFIAIVTCLGRMYRESEMAVWFSSGISLARFVKPVMRAGWPVLLVVGLLGLFGWPWVNAKLNEVKQRYEQRSDLSRVAPGAFQASADGRRVFFVERSGDLAGGARNVFMLTRDESRESVTTARSGRVERDGADQLLRLDSGFRNEVDLTTQVLTEVGFEHFSTVVASDQAQAAQTVPPKAMPTLNLIRQGGNKNLGELAWRLGVLLAAANMLLLGIATAATNPRRTSNWNLLFALLTFVIYVNLINLSQAWVGSGRMSLAGALLGLHGGALVFAVGLIWWRDHSAVRPSLLVLCRLRRAA